MVAAGVAAVGVAAVGVAAVGVAAAADVVAAVGVVAVGVAAAGGAAASSCYCWRASADFEDGSASAVSLDWRTLGFISSNNFLLNLY